MSMTFSARLNRLFDTVYPRDVAPIRRLKSLPL